MNGNGYGTREMTDKLRQTAEMALEALADMNCGWKYIRESHGDLYGVGWDRAQEKADDAIEALRQALNQLPDATKMIDKVCIKYWREVTMESGRWATTDSMSRDTAEKLLSDEYREAFPWGEIVEAKLKEKNNE
jgi:hypothetical protein